MFDFGMWTMSVDGQSWARVVAVRVHRIRAVDRAALIVERGRMPDDRAGCRRRQTEFCRRDRFERRAC
jgi:hypothetical protein